ncbi:TerB N-terminal domain-containing protein [Corallococcus sp. AS-1-6]|uniref:tellurite resistance TerB family protein n=1 Tax=Corallococcus sp. AS-1-6 TaxID=2874599 RepID=UPI0027D2530A|nr:TerB N-terminal domain-containing protein [Corallococcus sp. AS-1-6]
MAAWVREVPIVMAASQSGDASSILCVLVMLGLAFWGLESARKRHKAGLKEKSAQAHGRAGLAVPSAPRFPPSLSAPKQEEVPPQRISQVPPRPDSVLPEPRSAAPARTPERIEPSPKLVETRGTTWIPPGQSVEVAGRRIPGGMVYVGDKLAAVNVPSPEPALINPRLQVASRPDRSGEGMNYWPSYSTISPACRAGYLEWLEEGRRRPDAYIGYVFLFFYGLERRTLIDLAKGPVASAEVRAMEEEVQGLLRVYGANGSFRRYATQLLDVLRVRRVGEEGLLRELPQFALRSEGEASFDVRVAVGTAASRQLPLPADWALAWAIEASDTRLRTPATRCPEEFKTLFRARYARDHGQGLVPRARRTQVKAQYQPASASFGGMVPLASATVFEASESSLKPLHSLIEDCCAELEPFSRWIGKNPEGRESLAALALLPPELAAVQGGKEVQALRSILEGALAGRGVAALEARTLMTNWPTAAPAKMSKAEAVGLAQTLEKLGYGMEPDPRFSGPVLATDEAAVVFVLPPESPSAPAPTYLAALATLHLAAAVATADGTVSPEEKARLESMLENSQDLSPPEKVRLKAHLDWLLKRPASTAGLKKRVDSLTPAARAALGRLLVEVAVADGSVALQELKTLSKLYPLLGLDEARVHADIHTVVAARAAPAVEPVAMQLAGAPAKGFTLPAPPAEPPPQQPEAKKKTGVALDMRSVQAKLVETAAVSSLLGSIFAEEEPAPPAPAAPAVGEAHVAGLDAAHSALLRALVAKAEWPRAEVEQLASGLGLLTDGALDVINDAAFEVCGEPVLEGDEVLQLNEQAAQEMVA